MRDSLINDYRCVALLGWLRCDKLVGHDGLHHAHMSDGERDIDSEWHSDWAAPHVQLTTQVRGEA